MITLRHPKISDLSRMLRWLSLIALVLVSTWAWPTQAAAPPDPPLQAEGLKPPFPPPEAAAPSTPLVSGQAVRKTFPVLADTELRQSNPTQNYGIDPTLAVGYDNHLEHHLIQRALLHFNVASYLPPGTTIHQATLQLYVYDSGYCDGASSTFRAYRVTNDWSEMTATWQNQPGIGEAYGSNTIPIPPPADWATFDVTALVNGWVNGTWPEQGLMLRGPENPPYPCAFRSFRSKGGGGYTTAPELVVDYTLPAPALNVSTNEVTFFKQCGVGAPDPAPLTIALQSNSTFLKDWNATITGGDEWLTVSKNGGKVSSLFPDRIRLTVSETTPCPATLTGSIQTSATGLGNSPQTIQVTFQQSAVPLKKVFLPLINTGPHLATALPQQQLEASSVPAGLALVIGVADYQYLNPPANFTALRAGVWGDDLLSTRSDAYEMQTQLRGDYETVYTLLEDQATKANIRFAIQRLKEDLETQASQSGLQGQADSSRVLIYFSGHGGPIGDTLPLDETDNLDELLGVYDTNDEPTFVDHILDDEFKSWLDELPTDNLAVIIDACNSGGMEILNTNRAVLAASQEDQTSIESSYLEHGVFTYYLLQAMLTASSDTNQDGWLSVQEIYDHAHGPVANYVASHTSGQQDLALDLTKDFNVVRVPTP